MDWRLHRTVENTLAMGVLLVVAATSGIVPIEYPSWPALGGAPVNPELVVPGALGVVAVGNAVRDGLGVRSIGIGALDAVTALLALTSLHTLYADACGCLFVGGLLTMAAEVPLAALVLGRRVIGHASDWYRRRSGASE